MTIFMRLVSLILIVAALVFLGADAVSSLERGGALGHPKVYLEMGDENFVECPYCDKRFVLKAGATHH